MTNCVMERKCKGALSTNNPTPYSVLKSWPKLHLYCILQRGDPYSLLGKTQIAGGGSEFISLLFSVYYSDPASALILLNILCDVQSALFCRLLNLKEARPARPQSHLVSYFSGVNLLLNRMQVKLCVVNNSTMFWNPDRCTLLTRMHRQSVDNFLQYLRPSARGGGQPFLGGNSAA